MGISLYECDGCGAHVEPHTNPPIRTGRLNFCSTWCKNEFYRQHQPSLQLVFVNGKEHIK